MPLKKCPRCELNYILDDGPLCSVCHEEVHGSVRREERSYLCSVCGEKPPAKGSEMCAACMADLRSVEMSAIGAEDEEKGDSRSNREDDPLSSLDEIADIDGDSDDELGAESEDEDAGVLPVHAMQARRRPSA